MLSWLLQNIATIIVSAVLIAIVVMIIVYLRRKKKNGSNCSCGCGCENCALSGQCHGNDKK
ncbi:MAG: FeoB-associated Cys-rich membrane protein [Acutalibacteraceae bacterium]